MAEEDFRILRNEVSRAILSNQSKDEVNRLCDTLFNDYARRHFSAPDLQEKENKKTMRAATIIRDFLISIGDIQSSNPLSEDWINLDSVDNCIRTLQILDFQGAARNVEVVRIAIEKGLVLKTLERRSFNKSQLKSAGIVYSRSHIHFLKSLYILSLEAPMIKESGESLRFLQRNFSVIRDFLLGQTQENIITLLLTTHFGVRQIDHLTEQEQSKFHSNYFTNS